MRVVFPLIMDNPPRGSSMLAPCSPAGTPDGRRGTDAPVQRNGPERVICFTPTRASRSAGTTVFGKSCRRVTVGGGRDTAMSRAVEERSVMTSQVATDGADETGGDRPEVSTVGVV